MSGKFTCTEFAVKRLTGVDLLNETGLKPEEITFENMLNLGVKVPCVIKSGNRHDLFDPNFRGVMLRIVPRGRENRHTVILRNVDYIDRVARIEDENSSRLVPLGKLLDEWSKTEFAYAECTSEV